MEENNSEEKLINQLSMPLYGSRNWIKLLGIMLIIGGAIYALSIIGIIFAWIPIWLGIILFQAGNKIEYAFKAGNKNAFMEVQKYLSRYFTIYGILMIIGLAIGVIVMIVFLSIGMSGLQEIIPKNDFY